MTGSRLGTPFPAPVDSATATELRRLITTWAGTLELDARRLERRGNLEFAAEVRAMRQRALRVLGLLPQRATT